MSEARDLTVGELAAHPLPPLDQAGDKHQRGRVLVVAGGAEVPGAAALCGIAALRAGAGVLQFAAAPAWAMPARLRPAGSAGGAASPRAPTATSPPAPPSASSRSPRTSTPSLSARACWTKRPLAPWPIASCARTRRPPRRRRRRVALRSEGRPRQSADPDAARGRGGRNARRSRARRSPPIRSPPPAGSPPTASRSSP